MTAKFKIKQTMNIIPRIILYTIFTIFILNSLISIDNAVYAPIFLAFAIMDKYDRSSFHSSSYDLSKIECQTLIIRTTGGIDKFYSGKPPKIGT